MKRIFLIIFILLLCYLVSCKGKNKEYKVTFKNGDQQEVVKYKENEQKPLKNAWLLGGFLLLYLGVYKAKC